MNSSARKKRTSPKLTRKKGNSQVGFIYQYFGVATKYHSINQLLQLRKKCKMNSSVKKTRTFSELNGKKGIVSCIFIFIMSGSVVFPVQYCMEITSLFKGIKHFEADFLYRLY